MNRSTLAALAVALMLGSGIAGYLMGRPGDSVDKPQPPRVASTTTPAAPPASTATAPTPIAQPPSPPSDPFAYRRLGIDSSRTEAEACLAFNKPLATGDVKFGDFIKLEPDARVALRTDDNRLCIAGLTYGQDYKVTLRQGLPLWE